MHSPILIEHSRRVLAQKVGTECFFKCAPEQHCRSNIFLDPAVQIAMTIAPRAGQILADLGVAVEHVQATSEPGFGLVMLAGETSSQRAAGAKASRFKRDRTCTMTFRTLSTPFRPSS